MTTHNIQRSDGTDNAEAGMFYVQCKVDDSGSLVHSIQVLELGGTKLPWSTSRAAPSKKSWTGGHGASKNKYKA